MTREAVMSMTDGELRMKAARLMGWRGLQWNNLSGGGKVWAGDLMGVRTENGTGENVPDYPNDIAAAWSLVEINPDWRWAVYELDGGGWCASPMKVIGVREEHNLWDHVGEASGETAQQAITRAFILAMEPS